MSAVVTFVDATVTDRRYKFEMKLTQHNYGKAKVRVLKVFRTGAIHSIKELDVQVMLQGNFGASNTKSDSRG